jgi:RNA polymerase sigma-70 factor (ECF subfamily)
MASSVEDYDRYIHPIEDRIIRCIWRIVRDGHDAEDALQDVLARIWKGRKRVFRHPNPTALILRMCANSAYDILRQRLRRWKAEDSVAQPAGTAGGQSPLAEMVQEEQQVQVLHAIGQLGRKQAAAVLLRLVEQMPYGQIAAALDCSEMTARVHVQKGREQLRMRLAHLQPTTGSLNP